MLKKRVFQRPKNELETYDKYAKTARPSVPDEMCIVCPSCKTTLFVSDLVDDLDVCAKCSHHFRINMRQRIDIITDQGSFIELYSELTSENLLDFPDYDNKLKRARLESGENEAVICGTSKIGGYDCALFVMEPYFMMGSMGTVVGEKITRIFEYALENQLPVVGFTVSGGARMQEGILSLMQMAKTSGAVKRHSDAGNLYITVLTDPTTGGVTASFAMEGDIIIAEPQALIGFAGPNIVEQTIKQKLPANFQRAEILKEKGFVDEVVDRKNHKEYLTKLLSFHFKVEV